MSITVSPTQDALIGRAVEKLEAAVLEPHAMAGALQAAGAVLGFDHFCLVHSNIRDLSVIAAEDSLACFDAYASGGWVETDYRAATVSGVSPGALYLDHERVAETTRLSSAIYNELYVPHNMAHFAGWREQLGDETWIYSLARSQEKGVVRPDETNLLYALMPHVSRAMSLALSARHLRVKGMVDFAEAMGAALVIIDSSGRVGAVNRRAEALLSADFGVRNNRLFANHGESQLKLDELAGAATRRTDLQPLASLVIHRSAGQAPILVRPVRVRGIGLDNLPGARILLTLVETGRPPLVAEQELRILFGLSAAEANVAALLAAGKDVQDIASLRGVAVGTIRAQIRRLFEKIDVRRIGELISVVNNVVRSSEHPSSR